MKVLHTVEISCIGEKCAMCLDKQSSHKVKEDYPQPSTLLARHPFTAYLCCRCFGIIFGGLAISYCTVERHPLQKALDATKKTREHYNTELDYCVEHIYEDIEEIMHTLAEELTE